MGMLLAFMVGGHTVFAMDNIYCLSVSAQERALRRCYNCEVCQALASTGLEDRDLPRLHEIQQADFGKMTEIHDMLRDEFTDGSPSESSKKHLRWVLCDAMMHDSVSNVLSFIEYKLAKMKM